MVLWFVYVILFESGSVGVLFRSLLCRPLPLDIGRCTCVIVKEAPPEGLDGGTIYSLYTNVRSLKHVLSTPSDGFFLNNL